MRGNGLPVAPAAQPLSHPMIYKFKSAATSNLVLLGPHGDAVLRLLGREPAIKGIVEAHDLPAAIAALRAATQHAPQATEGTAEDGDGEAPVSLRRRLWPVIEMFERAAKADVPVVWGA